MAVGALGQRVTPAGRFGNVIVTEDAVAGAAPPFEPIPICKGAPFCCKVMGWGTVRAKSGAGGGSGGGVTEVDPPPPHPTRKNWTSKANEPISLYAMGMSGVRMPNM